MAILALSIYAGGFAYTWDRKGFTRAVVWPVALGIVLAKIAEREVASET